MQALLLTLAFLAGTTCADQDVHGEQTLASGDRDILKFPVVSSDEAERRVQEQLFQKLLDRKAASLHEAAVKRRSELRSERRLARVVAGVGVIVLFLAFLRFLHHTLGLILGHATPKHRTEPGSHADNR